MTPEEAWPLEPAQADELERRGYAVVKVGEVPPWMEETNARQNSAGSCIGGIADWSMYPDFDVKLYRGPNLEYIEAFVKLHGHAPWLMCDYETECLLSAGTDGGASDGGER